MNENTITMAFNIYRSERQNLFQANDELIEAKKDLKRKEYKVYVDGLIDGKNENDRKMQYITHTEKDIQLVETKERDYLIAQMEFDLASYEVSRVKLLVAFLDLKNE